MIPGCLTGESEERETWTAGSLRAASSDGEIRLQVRSLEETSAVHVSGQHCDHASDQSGTSSNVVISRFKFSIQPESLILAQSERWRQA